MPRIKFIRDVDIKGASGPLGHEDRLHFDVGDVIDVTEESAAHFTSRGEAVLVEGVEAEPEPAAQDADPVTDDGEAGTSIDELPIDDKAKRALQAAGLHTVESLVAYRAEHGSLEPVKGIGKATDAEIVEAIALIQG